MHYKIWMDSNLDNELIFDTMTDLYDWLLKPENLDGAGVFQLNGKENIVPCLYVKCSLSTHTTSYRPLWVIVWGVATDDCILNQGDDIITRSIDDLSTEVAAQFMLEQSVRVSRGYTITKEHK